jgi:hypothetical protein
MSREDLTRAADLLREASAGIVNEAVAERAAGTAGRLERVADADRGPDHGQLARIGNTLREIEAETDGETTRTVVEAHEHLSAYRATVEGV